ncbi:MAG: CHASE2 domain-containing protein, partial [Gammaproteobacteria bacterium]|nr:CHASE2 domain-containing protein [Gammaproteobacteria bacterium]
SDIESGMVDKDVFRNSVVLIGVVAESVKDYFETPLSSSGELTSPMPGIVLHAHTVSQLVRMAMQDGKQISVWADSQEYLWICLWSVAGALIAFYAGVTWKLLIFTLVGISIISATALILFVNGWWTPVIPAVMAWGLSVISVISYLSAIERKQRGLLMDLFSRNVSSEVAKEIWNKKDEFLAGGRLSSIETVATVLFSDLENFTPVSEKLGPTRLMEWLNQYMDKMASIVIENNGIVDDYYGDAIKANFGVPLADDNEEQIKLNAIRAAKTALDMRNAVVAMNQTWESEGLPPVNMRIGICTGGVVAGFLGSSQRMKYTTIGDTVNTSARLESYGKELSDGTVDEQGCRILLSDSTRELLKNNFEMEEAGLLSLKGKEKIVKVYRLYSHRSV